MSEKQGGGDVPGYVTRPIYLNGQVLVGEQGLHEHPSAAEHVQQEAGEGYDSGDDEQNGRQIPGEQEIP